MVQVQLENLVRAKKIIKTVMADLSLFKAVVTCSLNLESNNNFCQRLTQFAPNFLLC